MKMGMKGVWAIPVIASVLILGVIGFTQDVFAPSAPLFVESCNPSGAGITMCIVVVDSDRNGCDEMDQRIIIPLQAVVAARITPCGGA